MLCLVTAALGDAPTAIIACTGILLGVVLAARGRRGEPSVARAAAPAEEPPAAPLIAPAVAAAPAAPAAPAVGHGTIRFVTQEDEPAPAPAAEAEPAPEPVAAEPDVAVEPEPAPPPPPPSPAKPAVPQVPPTTFRQGTIRVGGLPRRRDH